MSPRRRGHVAVAIAVWCYLALAVEVGLEAIAADLRAVTVRTFGPSTVGVLLVGGTR